MRSALLLLLVITGAFAASAAPSDSAKSDPIKSDAGRADGVKMDYVLQPQDVIRVQIFQEEDLTREVRISQEFTISLPLIGTVDLKGKTARQAEQLIRDLYDRDYLVNPQVHLIVVEYAKRTVSVVGQVNQPGVIEFPHEQGLTIAEAISRAGGPTRLAKLSKVILKRTKPDGTTEAVTIDVEAIMKGDSNESWPLQPGDVITVPERSI